MIIKKKLNTKAGFTLIEMLVSLAIITAMTVVFLANYNGGNRSGSLSLSIQQAASNIRVAQNKAMGSTTYNGNQPLGGWGVHFDVGSTKYIIFADVNGNKRYDSSPDEGLPTFGGQSVALPKNVVVSSIVSSDQLNPNPTSLDITFIPPDPTTMIYDSVGTSSVDTITIKDAISNQTARITVNSLGLAQIGQ